MTSKHHMWQTRWRFDRATSQLTHESGLVVSVHPDGSVLTPNVLEIERALAVKNGMHNAPRMVRRLLREAMELAARPERLFRLAGGQPPV